MRRLIAYSLGLVLAVVISYSAGAVAGFRTSDTFTPIHIPSPTQHDSVGCGTVQTLANFTYWPRPSDTRYVAIFKAWGGPGKVQIQSSTDQRAHVTLPANSPPQQYELEVSTGQLDAIRGGIGFVVGVITDRCAMKGTPIVVEALNIFVSP